MKLLLVAAWISVDLALLDWTLQQGIVWPHMAAAAVLGVALGQCSLVAMWCAWSSANGAFRVALALLGLFALAWLASTVVAERAAHDKWFTLLLLQATIVVAVCLADALLNPHSLRAVFQSGAQSPEGTPGARPYQFSLAGLLTLTTASALALGTLQWTALPAKPLSIVTAFCVLTAANCYATLRLLPQPRWYAALAGILLSGVFLGWLMGKTGLPPCEPDQLLLTAFAQAATVASSLAVFRISAS